MIMAAPSRRHPVDLRQPEEHKFKMLANIFPNSTLTFSVFDAQGNQQGEDIDIDFGVTVLGINTIKNKMKWMPVAMQSGYPWGAF